METNLTQGVGFGGGVPAGFSKETGTDRDALAQVLVEQVLKVCLVEEWDRETLTLAVMDLLGELRPKGRSIPKGTRRRKPTAPATNR